ncbi:MAG: T9SS type A sorting domain-containing protein, partial [Saprospiraceae bacterium]|nr:T9SS type A sorting domain-containing protein [Saprospiraceae bacterium]
FQDRNGSNSSSGDEPDGGQDLIFDHVYTPGDDPASYSNSAVVNLFYWVNTVHDFAQLYGFDEAAGNFQQTNYSGQGLGGDYLRAHAQDGFGLPTPNVNNANYSGGEDGSSGQIQMFVWDDNVGGGAKYVTVTEPESVAGGYPSVQAQFGADVPEVPIVAEVVEFNDGIYQPYITDACEPSNNPSALAGKIALVDRGGCFFEQKTVWAQEAGAIAVIMCNFEEDPLGMAGVPDLEGTIPTVSMGATDCATIRVFAGNGLTVSLGQPDSNGPAFLDGDFDNGIIAHEFAHGISNRLTGGPGSATCLFNAEQMGEGWSDFFSLIMSVKPGETGDTPRGVGTFVFRQDNQGRGLRRYPYTTDMSINPLTLADVAANTEVHALGEVWTAVLWDLYWALSEQYDFDADLMNGSGGNNLAVQLVMDGMKIQDCLPGFIEGRDGILTADQILTGGVNQCLIWEVFARRGMGFGASQGSSLSASDQVSSFEPLPPCVEELKMDKTLTPLVDAGGTIEVSIDIINHKPETQTGVKVIDQLPEGLTYVDGSANYSAIVDGDQLSFEIGNVIFNEELTLTYQVETDASAPSIQQHFDGLESGAVENWAVLPVEGTNVWALNGSSAYEGSNSFKVESVATESQQIVFSLNDFPVVGSKPTLRFYHNYDTEHGQDGGVVQVTDDIDLGVWENLGDHMLRGSYQGPLDYSTFVIPNFQAFYGESAGYTSSYIDLSDFMGKELYFRYNFGTSDGDGPVSPSNGFWEFDNFELMDLVHYNWETCLTNEAGFSVCEFAPDLGTVIESEVVSGIEDLQDEGFDIQLYPNPANDFVTVSLQSNFIEKATLSIFSIDGKLMKSQTLYTNGGLQQEIVQTYDLLPGFYFVRVDTSQGHKTQKLIIQ